MASEIRSSSGLGQHKSRQKFWLGIAVALIFLFGIGIRLYDLQDPPLDFHAVRQLRSALISRSIYYSLSPDYTVEQKELASELASLETYEPPILESIVAAAYLLTGSEKLWISRVILCLYWVVGGAVIWLLIRKYVSTTAAVISLSLYFLLPFSVVASRSFQPEPFMVMWIALFVLVIDKWSEKQNWAMALLAGVLAGMAVMVKVVAALYIFPVLAAVTLHRLGLFRVIKSVKVWTILSITVLPALIHYGLLQPERSGSFMSFWSTSFSWMLLTTNFYADWLAMIKGLMGLFVFTLALLGVILAKAGYKPILIGLWAGYLIYGLIFPYQYTTHEYYHLPLVAVASLSIAPVFSILLENIKIQPLFWRVFAAGIIIFSMGYNLWVSRSILYASDYTLEPVSWQEVGEAIPEGSSVVALTGDSGMRLRYYGWRKADIWPADVDLNLRDLAGAQQTNFDQLFQQYAEGKDYFLVTALSQLDNQPDLKEFLYTHYRYDQGNGYLLFHIR